MTSRWVLAADKVVLTIFPHSEILLSSVMNWEFHSSLCQPASVRAIESDATWIVSQGILLEILRQNTRKQTEWLLLKYNLVSTKVVWFLSCFLSWQLITRDCKFGVMTRCMIWAQTSTQVQICIFFMSNLLAKRLEQYPVFDHICELHIELCLTFMQRLIVTFTLSKFIPPDYFQNLRE